MLHQELAAFQIDGTGDKVEEAEGPLYHSILIGDLQLSPEEHQALENRGGEDHVEDADLLLPLTSYASWRSRRRRTVVRTCFPPR